MQLNRFKIFIIFLFFTSCASKPISTQLLIQTKENITTLRLQIKNSSCKNDEKEIFYKELDKIKNNMNLVASSCEMEKTLLTEKITKLKLLLVFILCVFFIIKGVKYV